MMSSEYSDGQYVLEYHVQKFKRGIGQGSRISFVTILKVPRPGLEYLSEDISMVDCKGGDEDP